MPCVVPCGSCGFCIELVGSQPAGRPVKKLLAVTQVKNGGCLDLGNDGDDEKVLYEDM